MTVKAIIAERQATETAKTRGTSTTHTRLNNITENITIGTTILKISKILTVGSVISGLIQLGFHFAHDALHEKIVKSGDRQQD